MKALRYLFVLCLLFLGTAQATKVRVSILFVHYSVGTTIVDGYCWDDQYRRHIMETLDTMTVTSGTDTARVVFRSYRMNNDPGGNPLGDTLPGEGSNGCGTDRFAGFRYDFSSGSYNRMRIWNSDYGGLQGNAYAGLLDEFFNVPDKEQQQFWKIFQTHNTPSSFPDSVTEVNGYDLVIIKNPYACWFGMTQARSDSIKVLYQAVRDSIIAHPEINVALAFGTPLRLGHEVIDSAQARITYDLMQWFISDNFFTHDNNGTYKNIWKWDSYTPLLELGPVANKYCLATEYYQVGDGGSHLSHAGKSVGQESLVAFIRSAVTDILIRQSGTVTREEIDIKIKQFRDGTATEQEVLDLIQQYNTGGN